MNDPKICGGLVAFQPEALRLKRAGSAEPDVEVVSWQIYIQPNLPAGTEVPGIGQWSSLSNNRIPDGWRYSAGVIPVVSGPIILISREVTES